MFHFSCDHGAPGIEATGEIRPNYNPLLELELAWFTDLPHPTRDDVGLTSEYILKCDRTKHRFEVDPDLVTPWFSSPLRARKPILVLDLESYGKPKHWFYSLRPVPILDG